MPGTQGQGTFASPIYKQVVSPNAVNGYAQLYQHDNLSFAIASGQFLGPDGSWSTSAATDVKIFDLRAYKGVKVTMSCDTLTGGTAPIVYPSIWEYDNDDQANAKPQQKVAGGGTAGAIPATGGQYIVQAGDVFVSAAGSGTAITTTLYSLPQRLAFARFVINLGGTANPTGWTNCRFFVWAWW